MEGEGIRLLCHSIAMLQREIDYLKFLLQKNGLKEYHGLDGANAADIMALKSVLAAAGYKSFDYEKLDDMLSQLTNRRD